MALTPSFPGPSGLATTTHVRKALAGLVTKGSSGAVRTGVLRGGANELVTPRGNLNVDIGPFEAVADQFGGAVLFSNDGTAQLPSNLSAPIAGSNFYVVYAKQNESASPGTDANNTTVFGAVVSGSSFSAARSSGTRLDGSGSGLPVGAVELATVQVPSGTAATNAGAIITQTFQYTAGEGGIVRFRTKAALDADTSLPAGTYAEVFSDTAARNGLYRSTGSAWIAALGPVETGTASLGVSWYTPLEMRLTKRNGEVTFRFEGRRSALINGGGVVAGIPAGFRGDGKYDVQAYGYGGSGNPQHIYYDSTAHQVKHSQPIPFEGYVSFTLRWTQTS